MSNGRNAVDYNAEENYGARKPNRLMDDLGHGMMHEREHDFGIHQSNAESVAISIAIDPVALINTECITVTSAMRKHARWAHSSVSAILGGGTSNKHWEGPSPFSSAKYKPKAVDSKANGHAVSDLSSNDGDDSLVSRWGLKGRRGKSLQDNPLLSAFSRLRSDLRGCTGL